MNNFCTDHVMSITRSRAAHLKHDYPTKENQPESLINEAISLTSIDDNSIERSESQMTYICTPQELGIDRESE